MLPEVAKYEPAKASSHPYPAAWGWNSSARAGNVTETTIDFPHQLQHTKNSNFIACAAGYNHSLLVDTNGMVYSFGDGRKGELGVGSQFGDQKPFKGGVVQAFPRMVTPTGSFIDNRDKRFIEVSGGGCFSLAREVSPDEGLKLVVGLKAMEDALLRLKRFYPESHSIQKAWAEVRQERFFTNMKSEGQVYVWGTGQKGQLGLDHITYSPYPQRILAFRDTNIVQVSAGGAHALAVDFNGRLYSWGCGKGGRLGHGDYNNRSQPSIVKFFNSLFVLQCAAGDSHSAIITASRDKEKWPQQQRRVSCFGRGAHGRLGNGTNRNQPTPVLVANWPPSAAAAQFRQISCGGAHTVVVGFVSVAKGIANPWGRESFVLCWGYGANGQLGTGYRYDSYQPVLARMPRCDPIESVAAGRTWTVCRSINGALYSFGKGLRGQLGQGKQEQFSLAPRKLNCAGAFLKISAGNAHNVSIAVHKHHLNDAITEAAAKQQGDNYDPYSPLVDLSLKKTESSSKYEFDCCRLTTKWNRYRCRMRFQCLDCGVQSICVTCARLCHRGHLLIDADIDSAEAAEALTAYRTAYNKQFSTMTLLSYSTLLSASNDDSTSKGVSALKKLSGKPGAAVQKVANGRKSIDFHCEVVPHQSAVLHLASCIRPKRTADERMPRASIFDLTLLDQERSRHQRSLLRCDPVLEEKLRKQRKKAARVAAKAAAEATIAARKAAERDRLRILRISRENAQKENIPRLNFEINCSISKLVALPLKESYVLSMDAPLQLSAATDVPAAATATAFAATNESQVSQIRSIPQMKYHPKIQCCGCSIFNSSCRLLSMIPEHPLEPLLAALEVIKSPKPTIQQVAAVAQEAVKTPPLSKSPQQQQRRIISLIPSSKKISATSAASKKTVTSLFSKKNQSLAAATAIESPPTEPTPHEIREEQLAAAAAQRAAEKRSEDEHIQQLVRTFARETVAVHILQRCCTSFLRRKKARRLRIETDIVRHRVCSQHYHEKILGTVFKKVDRVYARFREHREQKQMSYEEELMKKYTNYCKLQSGLIGIDAVQYSVRQLYGSMSTLIPRVADGVVSNAYRATHAFTYRSIRSQQLYLHHQRRVPINMLATLTADLPRTRVGALREGIAHDPDVNLFVLRFLRDRENEDWRQSILRVERLQLEVRKKAAAAALERLRLKQNAKKLAMLQAEAISLSLQNGLPPPPPGPPPRHIIRAAREKEKSARKAEELEEYKQQLQREDAPFNALDRGLESKFRKRRHSIADPSALDVRLCTARHFLQSSTRAKRTQSLPDLNSLYVETKPAPKETIRQITQSLDQYQVRMDFIIRVVEGVERAQVDSLYAGLRPETYFQRQIRLLFSQNFLDPRLPLEMQTLLRSGYRRRTIGEPERLHRQLQILLDVREKFSDFTARAAELYNMRRRRRSFDFGEIRDERTGIDVMLGYEYEAAPGKPTTAGLKRDSLDFEFRMFKAGFIELQHCSVQVRQRVNQLSYSNAEAGTRVTKSKSKMQNFDLGMWQSGSSKKRLGGGGSSKRGNFFSAARSASEKYREEYGDQFEMAALAVIEEAYEDGGYDSVTYAGSQYPASNYGTIDDSSHDRRGHRDQQEHYYNQQQQPQQQWEHDGNSILTDGWSGWDMQSQQRQIWQEHYTDAGQAYYYNQYTGESRWDFPSGSDVQLETQNEDENGNWYWFNTVTGESRWMEYS